MHGWDNLPNYLYLLLKIIYCVIANDDHKKLSFSFAFATELSCFCYVRMTIIIIIIIKVSLYSVKIGVFA